MKFSYSARTSTGGVQSGIVEAKDKTQAIETLHKYDLIILSLVAKETLPFFLKELKLFQEVKAKDVVVFSRQLSILFSAKIPLVESLKTVAKQTENSYFQNIISIIANDVEAGMSLSRALEKYSKIFSAFYINMIKSGEVAGTLEGVLNYLADYLEKQFYLSSKIRGAMVYPAFILTGFIIVSVLMLTMVIPHLSEILKETNQALPLSTKIVIGTSQALLNYGWMIGLILIIFISGSVYFVRNYSDGRKIWDNFKLKVPVLGPIFQKFYLSRLADSLSTLISGGIPILQSLQVAADVIDNVILKNIVLTAREEVRVGSTISTVFERYPEIPPMVTNMLSVGEQTGTIDMVLKKLSSFYAKEVDDTVSTLSQLIEPLLIVVLGLGVGILVASIFMPIYSIAGSL